jgi:outer membrane protein assembly factor BamA
VRALFGKWLLLAACFAACLGCRKIPSGADAVTAVSVQGLPSRSEDGVKGGLTTKPTRKFLGVIRGVYSWETLDTDALAKDVERIERQLARDGYYEARVTGVRIVRQSENEVEVEIDVAAGERVMIGDITTEGLAVLPFDAAVHASRAIDLEQGDPFDEAEYEAAKLRIANALADIGYAYVKVAGSAKVDLSTHRADVAFHATPGPASTLGTVTIQGLKRIPERAVRKVLQLEPGDTYSRAALDDARVALFRLGVFSRVEVIPMLTDSTRTVVPITVEVEEGAAHSVTAGGGAVFDVQRMAARGRVTWVDRNFLGGLREFQIEDRPGVTFYPLRFGYWEYWKDGITNVLPENSVTLKLTQPSFLEGRTKGIIETGYNVYPLLYPLPPEADAKTERVVGYNEVAFRTAIERTFLHDRLPVTFSLNWRSNFPFTYQGVELADFNPVTVTYPELQVMYDLRDDPIAPTLGVVFQANIQVAIPIVNAITDVRLRPEVRAYVPLDFKRRTVLALRGTLGLLFPENYGSSLTSSTTPDYTQPDTYNDQHKLLFRAFYSGGPSSNRGYAYQRIGPQGPIGFLLPSDATNPSQPSLATCIDEENPTGPLLPECIRPLGGLSLWEASLEIRRQLGGPWGLVLFADTSDVGAGIMDFNFAELHLSIGAGLRYASPIGPVRVDLGWRVPGMQKRDGPGPLPDVSEVEPYSLQGPLDSFALSILIGEAF